MNPLVGIGLRYMITMIGTALVTYQLVDADGAKTITEGLSVIASALVTMLPVLYGMWREPSKKGARVAAAVDTGQVKVIETPPGQPDKVIGTVGPPPADGNPK